MSISATLAEERGLGEPERRHGADMSRADDRRLRARVGAGLRQKASGALAPATGGAAPIKGAGMGSPVNSMAPDRAAGRRSRWGLEVFGASARSRPLPTTAPARPLAGTLDSDAQLLRAVGARGVKNPRSPMPARLSPLDSAAEMTLILALHSSSAAIAASPPPATSLSVPEMKSRPNRPTARTSIRLILAAFSASLAASVT